MMLAGKVMLITGASAGIGRALAIEAARTGAQVILLARSSDKLEELCDQIAREGGKAAFYTVDIADREALRIGMANILRDFPVIDILVNNAGVGWYGLFKDMPLASVQNLLAVNICALTEITWAVLPGMLTRGRGKILNISSIVGDLAVQGVALYAASKAYVNAFSRAIQRETHGSSVQVALCKIGPVSTDFFGRMKTAGSLHIPGEAMAIPVKRVAARLVRISAEIRQGTFFIPVYYGFFPLIERWLGWIIDLLGPVLLRVKKQPS